MDHSEHADALELVGASIGRTAAIVEEARARGEYYARAVGPREELREEYNAIMAQVREAQERHGRLTGHFRRMLARAEAMLELKWEDTIHNVVTTVGKNLALDTYLAGSGYTVTGPYMGLISSVSYGAGPVVGDTMASHAGWHEAGAGTDYPLYTAPRKTCAWNSASGGSKSLSAALSFSIITTGGTVKGCFIVYGTGAVSTIQDTNGTLYSAGTFTGGDKILGVGDTLQVSYTASL